MISPAEIKHLNKTEPKFDDIMLSLNAIGKQPKGTIKESKKIIAIARKFNNEIAKDAALYIDKKAHEDHSFLPWDYVNKANEYGLYTMFIPKMFGGKNYSMAGMAYFLEELASTCVAIANIVGVHYLGVTFLFSSWNMKIANKILKDVIEGEKSNKPCLLSLAMTEPNAGTDSQNVEFMDTGSLGCHAKKVEGGYVLNGTKIFISMGHLSTWHIVHVYTDLKKCSENAVIIAVKTGTSGFSFGKTEKKMGQKGSIASELIFNDCFIPDENVCLDNTQAKGLMRNIKDTNEQIFAYIWGSSRMGVGAFGVGAARGAYEAALKYASETKIDDQLLINHEWCQSMLAEMYKNVAISRAAYSDSGYANGMHGLWKIMNIKPIYYMNKFTPTRLMTKIFNFLCEKEITTKIFRKITFDFQKDEEIDRIDGWGSLAKFVGTDAGITNCRMALEIMGQAGVRQNNGAEKILRDVKLLQIYEGTNQVNRINLFKRLVAKSCPPEATPFSSSNY